MSEAPGKTLSVAVITKNEESNLARTLASVQWADEIIVVDAASTDRTAEIAHACGAKFFVEDWKGFSRQKNSALAKCSKDWVLSLDADEEVSAELATSMQAILATDALNHAYLLPRRNHFLGRWIRHGGYYPDTKLRFFPRDSCVFDERAVHETMRITRPDVTVQNEPLRGDLLHHCYPTLEDYIEHMNRYSSLGAGVAVSAGKTTSSVVQFTNNVLLNPIATFLYNYVARLGFLDGREGLLLHLYHSVYISWKYAKAWESRRTPSR